MPGNGKRSKSSESGLLPETAANGPSTEAPSIGRSTTVQRLRPEIAFLAISLTLGTCFVFLTPPFQVPDEEAHFFRSFQLSTGRMISTKQGNSTGDILPVALQTLHHRFGRLPFHAEEKTSLAEIRKSAELAVDPQTSGFVNFSNTAIHPPLTYLPQAMGMWLTRQVSNSALALLYGGRWGNLLACTAVLFWSIRRTPVCAWCLAALALSPMSLYLMSSLSSDALTNALSFAFVAHVLYCEFGPEREVRRRDIALAVALSMCVGLAKQAYFLLPVSFWMVSRSRFTSSILCWTSRWLMLAGAMAVVAAWALVVRDIYSPADPGTGIDPGRQVAWMLSHPIEYLGVLATTCRLASKHLEQYLGIFGWLDTRLPVGLLGAELVLLVAVTLGQADSRFRRRHVAVALGVAAVVVLCVYSIIYITWVPVGGSFLTLQGRYFIPIGPLVAVALAGLASQSRRWIEFGKRATPLVAAATIPCVLGASLFFLIERYYLDSAQATALRRHHAQAQARAQALANAVLDCARHGLVKRRYEQTERDGQYLVPTHDIVITTEGQPFAPQLGGGFVWLSPSPSGEELRLFRADGSPLDSGRMHFVACSRELIRGKRLFICTPPAIALTLDDRDVSWYYQRLVLDLTPEEQEREVRYRQQQQEQLGK